MGFRSAAIEPVHCCIDAENISWPGSGGLELSKRCCGQPPQTRGPPWPLTEIQDPPISRCCIWRPTRIERTYERARGRPPSDSLRQAACGTGRVVGQVEEVAQVGDQTLRRTVPWPDWTRPTGIDPLQRPEHRHADDAHDRHKQSPVIVTLDDEPPCNSRHFE